MHDLDIIDRVHEAAAEQGATALVVYGYAIEALTGGKITRPHVDIDCNIYGVGVPAEAMSDAVACRTGWQPDGIQDYKICFTQAGRRLDIKLFKDMGDTESHLLEGHLVNTEPLYVVAALRAFFTTCLIPGCPLRASDYYDTKRILRHLKLDREQFLAKYAEFAGPRLTVHPYESIRRLEAKVSHLPDDYESILALVDAGRL